MAKLEKDSFRVFRWFRYKEAKKKKKYLRSVFIILEVNIYRSGFINDLYQKDGNRQNYGG